MRKLILLNGPRNCGKSVVVQYLLRDDNFPYIVERRCKDKLIEMTCSIFSISYNEFMSIYLDKNLKEEPSVRRFVISHEEASKLYSYYGDEEAVYGLPVKDGLVCISCRDAMIYTSEFIIKPMFGKDYFGKARIDSMASTEIAIDDSAGFQEELVPAIEKLGQENIILFRIHGRGDWNGDSRSYIPDGVIDNTIDVTNDEYTKLSDFEEEIKTKLGWFLL